MANIRFQDYNGLSVPTFYTSTYMDVQQAHLDGYVVPHMQRNFANVVQGQAKHNKYLALELYRDTYSDTSETNVQTAERIASSRYADLFISKNTTGQLAFALIPSYSFSSIFLAIYTQEEHKKDWYDARNRNFIARIEELTTLTTNKLDKEFVAMAIRIVSNLQDWFGEISVRWSEDIADVVKLPAQIHTAYKDFSSI